MRVFELVRQFFYLAFLMRRPQDVQGGELTLPLGVGMALLSYVLALAAPFGVSLALSRALIDVVLTGAALWLGLRLINRTARFPQAFGGYCGAVAFVNLAAVPIYVSAATSARPDAGVADFVLLVWNLSLLGHILRHTFELRLPTGILLGFAYVIVLSALLAGLAPVAPA